MRESKNNDNPLLVNLEPVTGVTDNEEAEWDKLIHQIMVCRFCPLYKTRTKVVPGEGDRRARLMFVGEAPGRDEDLQGRPFVGRAGQLLTKIIQAMGLSRSQVYIANVIKCRPPENRTPKPEEIKACSPYLLKQIELIKPKVIVALGKVAVDFLLPGAKSMSEVRGNFGEFSGIPVMPTFHPSYLVRNEGNKEIKKMVWEDMKKVMKLLES
ncbi:MAG TPA: uracil-DNA glycosylase [Candidatus Aminicenantes bacterium]|nr:MAG: uracil-DNA glycosylase [Candidatus Aminicenantes bacterium]HEK85586.1 uracil-DNA glycosylase [Candidatus Aminicenantes bacterium]